MPRPVQVSERVWRIQCPFAGNAVQVYLVRGEKTALIDSGVSPSPAEAIEPCLGALGLKLGDVDYLINTHGHNDHMGGNGAIKAKAPSVEIMVHGADEELASGGVAAHVRSKFGGMPILRMLGDESIAAEREAVLTQMIGRTAGVDRVLSDGDVVDLGGDVRLLAIHTPGHTAGSTCYLLEAEGLLFTGDAVQARGWRPGVLPLYYEVSYLDSIKRIRELAPRLLCMGHAFQWSGVINDPVRLGQEVEATLKDSLEASAIIDQAVRQVLAELPGASFRELAEAALREIVNDLPAQFDRRTGLPPSSAAAINAHLESYRGLTPVLR